MPGQKLTAGKVALVAVVVLVAVALAVLVYVRRRDQLARLTAEAPAKVVSVSVNNDRARGNDRSRERTVISYTYAVGGQDLNGRSTKGGDVSGRYRIPAPVKVCYDPKDPYNSEIFEAEYRCGG